jgi:hypothetical protein
MSVVEHALQEIAVGAVLAAVGGWLLASFLRSLGLRWSWALLGFLAAFLVAGHEPFVFWPITWGTVTACALGGNWHHGDVMRGADDAEIARARLGVVAFVRRWGVRHDITRDGWVQGERLFVGEDVQGMPVSIPVGYTSGSHTLVVGATGSGKTVSEAWVTGRMIEAGHGALVVDPKGDQLIYAELKATAARAGREFLEWTPDGPLPYNPYGQGSDGEVADKALSGELFTEPHYLRQAQRYLGHAVRVMRAAGISVSPVSLMAHMDPRQLEASTRNIPDEHAGEVQDYLDSLNDRQRRELSGVRDRLSILAESELRRWLNPANGAPRIDIRAAVERRAVVYFRLVF